MKSFREELWFKVPRRRGFVNITGKVPGTGWYRVRGAKGTAGFVRNPDFRPRTAGYLP